MKDFKAKAWHRKYRKVVDVIGMAGLDTSAPVIHTKDTMYQLADVDLMLFMGERDQKNECIYEGYILEFVLKGEPGSESMLARGMVLFSNGRFKLMYEKQVSPRKIEVTELLNPNWKSMRIIGNIHDPVPDLKTKP